MTVVFLVILSLIPAPNKSKGDFVEIKKYLIGVKKDNFLFYSRKLNENNFTKKFMNKKISRKTATKLYLRYELIKNELINGIE